MNKFFSRKTGIIIAGLCIGGIAIALQMLGNPPNMGFCVACFERDIAGALGLHRADVVQYIRPEIIGFVIGALLISMITKEFNPRSGSAPVVRFFLGFFAMIGALVFLGCPWRTLLRLAGGDGNAIFGFAGLVAGIGIGVGFLKKGYSLGRSYSTGKTAGLIFPFFMVALFLLLVFRVSFSENGPIFFSQTGPGSMHAGLWISIIAGLVVGVLAQKSRFCTMGAIRDIILMRDFHLATGIISFFVIAIALNLVFGKFHPGFEGQPIAHTNQVWNFLGMTLSGLCFVLAGGCPGRQLILAGEGDGDSAVFALGMIIGAAFSHNFAMASSPKGTGPYGAVAVAVGLVIVLLIGFTMKEKSGSTSA